ncbi:GNAT family N-acetyltransferase [Halostella litorea]|uniref:GNAT family N-acetyltransferase n=1 Tax=Halostella litorea TaxID=2528831 RepID=UPI001092FD3B|nr:GNAT family N-acetyltransferase [Halostella litorea]
MAFLEGSSVELVPLDPSREPHVRAYARSRTDPEMRTTGAYGGTVTREAASEWIERKQSTDAPNALCAIRVAGDTVGWAGCRVDDLRARTATLGYYVLPEEQGNGYATEAASLLVAYAFQELNAHKVAAEVQADNPASERVLEKIGFECEGTRRDHHYKDGDYRDISLWGVTEAEFDPA